MPWFPYGFENGSDIPVYHELYPNALKEISEGVSGYIYEVFAIAFVQAPLGGAGAGYKCFLPQILWQMSMHMIFELLIFVTALCH